MGLMTRVRVRHITLMSKTLDTLGNVLKTVTDEQATTLTDGPDGWTVLEVLCHLRDFDEIFFERARQMVEKNQPVFISYDQNALAVERKYKEQNITQVYVDLVKTRRAFIEFFQGLTDETWDRTALHPRDGLWTLTDSLMQIGHHDANHIEQITRILTQGKA